MENTLYITAQVSLGNTPIQRPNKVKYGKAKRTRIKTDNELFATHNLDKVTSEVLHQPAQIVLGRKLPSRKEVVTYDETTLNKGFVRRADLQEVTLTPYNMAKERMILDKTPFTAELYAKWVKYYTNYLGKAGTRKVKFATLSTIPTYSDKGTKRAKVRLSKDVALIQAIEKIVNAMYALCKQGIVDGKLGASVTLHGCFNGYTLNPMKFVGVKVKVQQNGKVKVDSGTYNRLRNHLSNKTSHQGVVAVVDYVARKK